MTGPEFATSHGSSDTWTTADIETQQNLAAIDQLPPAPAATTTIYLLPGGTTGHGKTTPTHHAA